MSETVTQVNETTQQIVRSRTCGLKDFYIALVQSNTATAYTAGTPVKLARAIKAISIHAPTRGATELGANDVV